METPPAKNLKVPISTALPSQSIPVIIDAESPEYLPVPPPQNQGQKQSEVNPFDIPQEQEK